MRTIGYFDDSTGHSGTTRYLLELLNALDRARYRPVVFSPSPAPWHQGCRELGAEVVTGPERAAPPSGGPITVRVPMAWASRGRIDRLRRSLALVRGVRAEVEALRRLFLRHPVELLHSNNAGDEVAPIAARKAGIPIVVGTLHVDPTYDLFHERTGMVHRWLRTRSLEALDLAIAVSERTRDEWRREIRRPGKERPRFVVVPNGIRVDRLARRRPIPEAKQRLGVPADALVIGSLGRLDWAKGYGDLVAALPEVRRVVPGAIFLHAGGGPLAGELAAQAEALGVSGMVRWLGYRTDVRDLLEATDLYVQPSWCEAHTLSVLEAGALDLPVVATDVGGHRETLETDRGGWIVPARHPEALAGALIAALQAEAARATRGQWLGEQVRTHYTHDRMVAETMALYDALLTPAGTP